MSEIKVKEIFDKSEQQGYQCLMCNIFFPEKSMKYIQCVGPDVPKDIPHLVCTKCYYDS